MRIAIDTQATLGRKTGIGHYTASLAAALCRLEPELALFEVNWGRDVEMRTDRRLRWQQWELPRRAQSVRSDVLHVTGFDAPIWKPCPVVMTVHDLIGVLFPENLPRAARFYWSRWLPWTIRFADLVIADSESTRRDLMRLVGVSAERIHVIPLGVGDGFRTATAEEIAACRARYGLPAEILLYVGTIEPRKGLDTLIDAFAALKDRFRHDLVIVGKRGWRWEPVIRRVYERGLVDRVRFLDYVPDGDRPALYGAAALVALPSRYEGFGLPVLEAMACGTPVACSDVSSLPEVAGDAAVLVPVDDRPAWARAIESVLADPELAARLSRSGRARARAFTWDRTARETRAVYERALHRRGGGG